MVNRFVRIFLQGLVALLPLVLTVYLVFLLGWWLEDTMRGILTLVIPDPDPAALDEGERLPTYRYYPGMGLVLAVLLIFGFGLVLKAYLVKRLYSYTESVMQRIPVVKSIHGATKDFLAYFSSSQKQMNQVVLVDMPGTDRKLLGLVTRQSFEDLPEGMGSEHHVAVYLPMSYQIGGYTLILPRSQVQEIDMSIEDGARFALTAGISEQPREPTAVEPLQPQAPGEEPPERREER